MATIELKENTSELSDSELVKESLKNQDFFFYIIKRYETKLISYINRLTNVNNDEAQDILQDVFLKVYLNLNDYKDDLKFSSWIYRIAHNQVISNYRKISARPEGHSLNIDEIATKNIIADVNIDLSADLTIARENISRILSKMSRNNREILILKFLEEKSYREISDIIKKPQGTIASMINRAKKEFIKIANENNIQF